jgi:hypothetical protein
MICIEYENYLKLLASNIVLTVINNASKFIGSEIKKTVNFLFFFGFNNKQYVSLKIYFKDR